MTNDLAQAIAVGVILLLAVAWIVRRLLRRRRSAGCEDCAGCPLAQQCSRSDLSDKSDRSDSGS